ncbi:DUF3427 domain-containing protein [Halarcobacter anaerophilus]|uniref:DNA repair helicase n=1 Tax=Halarcobacter anaerophilus TaxID=877500 RepID=A0A4Q0Y2A2_9BACT|nr:DUF3427 domain-containing protein [Halarcobacter anaerophilus]QDF27840.1 DNA/RNA helicase (DUF3427 domain) [Halarcobacter anaerophilus]RXJ64246.1 DNA repair helicase [Halarcobacter anaerophilus]
MNQLITNNQNSNFYNHLTKLLLECNSFIFNVAFINYSGVQLLLNCLEELKKKGIKGKILSSTYLNFTEVEALKKLQEFENIELKIYDCTNKGFHAKAYIFEFEEEYKILLGSSNITSSAFKTNIEWNIKSISKKNEEFSTNILQEFKTLWEDSFFVTKDFLQQYGQYKLKTKVENFVYEKELKINSMQKQALEKLDFFRRKKETKALAIAATGTGKTYLAAFDVKAFSPKKMLFIVHRENILQKAKKSFEAVIKNIECGFFTGNKKEQKASYLFATVQTLSANYKKFSKEEFDYIIYDEAHHITSPSYEKITNYFKPKFSLGLTATPNRMDGNSIYEVFDDNIACDIRLNEALENNLVVPFHYYGVTDIKEIDYESVDLKDIVLLSKLLMVNKRVDFIIQKLNFYGNSGDKRRVLGFCASKEHAKFMSDEFNKKGIVSAFLTSEDSVLKREKIIKELENEKNSLEVVFSVDIFNEGVDIPSVNTVLMLRPTNSPIVFIQQLGRGLRKYKSKEFLTIIDFIGNHKKAFLIALALCGNKILDKESIKFSLLNNFADFANAHIVIDEISKQRVLEQINSENLSSFKYLKSRYFEFKALLGNKVPKIEDFINYDEFISPVPFILESKSYIEFLQKVEKTEELKELCSDENFLKAVRFIDFYLPLRRVYEFVILKYLLSNECCSLEKAFKILDKYLNRVDKETIKHSFSYLNQEFFDSSQKKRFLKLVFWENEELKRTQEFEKLLENKDKKNIIENSLNYGILTYEKSFGSFDFGLPFLKLYEKYNMQEIALLSNFDKIHSSFRGSGFLKFKDDFFLFITLEKDKFAKGSHYENNFLSKDCFTFISKPKMSQDKGDGKRLINNKKEKAKLHIFVRKFSHVDKKVQKFLYLGLANCIKYEGNQPIKTWLKLEKPLNNKIYEEFTKII